MIRTLLLVTEGHNRIGAKYGLLLACDSAGSNSAAITAMLAITTSSSISVNPRRGPALSIQSPEEGISRPITESKPAQRGKDCSLYLHFLSDAIVPAFEFIVPFRIREAAVPCLAGVAEKRQGKVLKVQWR